MAYGAQIAAQLGAHIIKVKPPTAHIDGPEAAKVFKESNIRVDKMSDRVRHVVESSFNGRRIVIFSGGETKTTEALLKEVGELALGGAFGSIMGRNAFQRPKAEAIELLHKVQDAFAGKPI